MNISSTGCSCSSLRQYLAFTPFPRLYISYPARSFPSIYILTSILILSSSYLYMHSFIVTCLSYLDIVLAITQSIPWALSMHDVRFSILTCGNCAFSCLTVLEQLCPYCHSFYSTEIVTWSNGPRFACSCLVVRRAITLCRLVVHVAGAA